MKKVIFTLSALFMALSTWAQTYNNGTWYSLYSTTEQKTDKNGFTTGKDFNYSVFAPTTGNLSFEWKKSGKVIGYCCIFTLEITDNAGTAVATISSDAKSTTGNENWITEGKSVNANITRLTFNQTTTLQGSHKNVKLPLAKHILLADGTYGTTAYSTPFDFGSVVFGTTATTVDNVQLRSFLTNGNITITSSDPQTFRINSADNTSAVTYNVGANACASANGAANATCSAGVLGNISKYNFSIYFCPAEDKNYTGTITISDGTSTATIAVKGTGIKKSQSITWNQGQTTLLSNATIATATADSELPVTYEISNSLVSFSEGSFHIGETTTPVLVSITAKQDGNDEYYAAESVTKNFTINPAVTYGTEHLFICQGSSIEYHGTTYTDATETEVTIPNVYGGDSIITLTVSVNPTYTGILDGDTICASDLETYTWEGETFTKDGLTKTKTLTSVLGCDSIVTFTLTINPTYEVTNDAVTLCQGEQFDWNDVHIAAVNVSDSKDYTYNGKTIAGCDSIVHITLTVNPTYNVSDPITKCENELPFMWNGETISSAADNGKQVTLASIHGCDSVVTLALTVYPTYNVSDPITKCDSELPFTWNGETISSAADNGKQVTLASIHGCDSVVTLALTIYPTYDVIDPITTCESALPFTWNGETITSAADNGKQVTLASIHGCDSVVTLALTITSALQTTDYLTTCENALPFTWNEMEITSAADNGKQVTLVSVLGCDSVVTLALTVNSSYTDIPDGDTICASDLETYTWEGETFTKDELTKTKTLTTVLGCDSVVTFTLTLLPEYKDITVGDTICESDLETYTWEGETFTKDELTKTKTLTTVLGCDSVVTFTLTLLPEYKDITDGDTICESDLETYTWEGETFTKDELTKTKTLQTKAGCDSVVTFTLTVNPAYEITNDAVTLCQGEPFDWNDVHITSVQVSDSKDYTYSRQTTAGCDSIAHITLTVHPVYKDITDGDTICESDLETYTWEGETFTKDELTKTKTLTTVLGCDSIVTFTLTINPTYLIDVIDTIMEGTTFIWNNKNYGDSVAGEYNDTIYEVTTQGCDSIIALSLTINSRETPTAILESRRNEEVEQAEKFVMNGHLYIRRKDGAIYDAQGILLKQ